MEVYQKLPRRFDMELLVSSILRIGLFISLGLLLRGLAWRWWRTGEFRFDYQLPRANVLQFVEESIHQTTSKAFRPRLFNNLGIVVLMLTPYTRVLASMFYFAFSDKNWKYTLFTSFVLAMLTYSLLLR